MAPTWLIEPLERAGGVKLGPFISQKNGKTLMSASSFSSSLVRISKNNGPFAPRFNVANPPLSSDGWYIIALSLEDLPTETGGHIIISIHVPGYLPVWRKFQVKQIIPIVDINIFSRYNTEFLNEGA